VFPRTAREDPFLRDPVRAAMRTQLATRVPVKTNAFDEEKQLCALTIASAAQHVTVMSNRCTDDGDPVNVSWYWDELRRSLGHHDHGLPEPAKVLAIPRHWFPDDTPYPEYHGTRLTVAETVPHAIGAGDTRIDDWARLRYPHAPPEFLAHAIQAAQALDSLEEDLGSRDGIAGSPGTYALNRKESGYSATALETYARCPFQFFAGHVLRLHELDAPDHILAMEPPDRGTLQHKILERLFTRLKDENFFQSASADMTHAHHTLADCIEEEIQAFAPSHAMGLPLVWDIMRADVTTVLEDYIDRELPPMGDPEGYAPLLLEHDLTGRLPDRPDWPGVVRKLPVHGFVDRLDEGRGNAPYRYRVVDYKSKTGRGAPASHTNMPQRAARGYDLQPPIYLALTQATQHNADAVRVEFHYLASQWDDGVERTAGLDDGFWESAGGAEFSDTMAHIINGLHHGNFFVLTSTAERSDSDYCSYCAFTTICRREHRPTRYRATQDGRYNDLVGIRNKTVKAAKK